MSKKLNLKLRFKVIAFLILYSIVFYFYRQSSYFNYRVLVANLDSIPWLYSSIGLIFGIISAFIIQKEWQQWSGLVDAIKTENSALYELWLWSERLPQVFRAKIREQIKSYLSTMISEGWKNTEEGETSAELERIIKEMHCVIAELDSVAPIQSSIAFSLMNNILAQRERRIHLGSSHMPDILLYTLRLATFLMIALGPLIAVKTFELHYIFSISIAFLSYIIYLVAYDMDHPLQPGGWHLTTIDYKKLLTKLQQ